MKDAKTYQSCSKKVSQAPAGGMTVETTLAVPADMAATAEVAAVEVAAVVVASEVEAAATVAAASEAVASVVATAMVVAIEVIVAIVAAAEAVVEVAAAGVTTATLAVEMTAGVVVIRPGDLSNHQEATTTQEAPTRKTSVEEVETSVEEVETSTEVVALVSVEATALHLMEGQAPTQLHSPTQAKTTVQALEAWVVVTEDAVTEGVVLSAISLPTRVQRKRSPLSTS